MDSDWTIDVDNDRPLLGDSVIIEARSIYANEYAVVGIYRDGVRLQQLLVRTNVDKVALAMWNTTLDMVPATYELRIEHFNRVWDNITVTLVYDPLDYALKSIVQLENEVDRLEERDENAETWSKLALKRIDYYMWRWGIGGAMLSALNLIVLFYLFPEAWNKYIKNQIALGKAPRSAGRLPHGVLQFDHGKETMMDTPIPREPTPGKTAWCPKCEVLVHKAEWKKHAGHDLDFGGYKLRPKRKLVVRRKEPTGGD